MVIAAGAKALASDIVDLRTRIETLEAGPGDPPRVQVRNAAGQSIATATFTAVVFELEDFDSDNAHSTASNTDRITIPKAGVWRFAGGISFAGNATGTRICRLTKNGTVISGSGGQGPNLGAGEFAFAHLRPIGVTCALNDIIRMEGWQNSGGNLSTGTTDWVQPVLSGMWLSA